MRVVYFSRLCVRACWRNCVAGSRHGLCNNSTSKTFARFRSRLLTCPLGQVLCCLCPSGFVINLYSNLNMHWFHILVFLWTARSPYSTLLCDCRPAWAGPTTWFRSEWTVRWRLENPWWLSNAKSMVVVVRSVVVRASTFSHSLCTVTMPPFTSSHYLCLTTARFGSHLSPFYCFICKIYLHRFQNLVYMYVYFRIFYLPLFTFQLLN